MKRDFDRSLRQHIAALTRRRCDLQALIEKEMRRPLPCRFTLQRLKKMRLALKDRMAHVQGRLGQAA